MYTLTNHIIDPQWKYAQHLAQYVGLITLRMTQSDVIPYNIDDLYYRVNQWMNNDFHDLLASKIYFHVLL